MDSTGARSIGLAYESTGAGDAGPETGVGDAALEAGVADAIASCTVSSQGFQCSLDDGGTDSCDRATQYCFNGNHKSSVPSGCFTYGDPAGPVLFHCASGSPCWCSSCGWDVNGFPTGNGITVNACGAAVCSDGDGGAIFLACEGCYGAPPARLERRWARAARRPARAARARR